MAPEIKHKKNLGETCQPLSLPSDKKREFSSVGLEHLPYKQRVGGSTPSTPTKTPQQCGVLYLLAVIQRIHYCCLRSVSGTQYERVRRTVSAVSLTNAYTISLATPHPYAGQSPQCLSLRVLKYQSAPEDTAAQYRHLLTAMSPGSSVQMLNLHAGDIAGTR